MNIPYFLQSISPLQHPKMLIISRDKPPGLQYRVCVYVVTSACTPFGVTICKILLKAKALVLGVDPRAKEPSLNAGLGARIQFVSCNLGRGDGESRWDAERFGVERCDVLVNVLEWVGS